MPLARLEHAALLAFAFVVPLLEAPKNLLWLAWLALWIANRARSGNFGGRWDLWDTLAALLVASGYAAGGFSADWDIPKYASVLVAMKRGGYSDRALLAALLSLAAGTLAALGWGYWSVFVAREHSALGLHSVGHVNHSAIYLAIVFGAALMATRAWWRHAGAAWRLAGLAACVIFGVSLIVMQSRAAVGAAFLVAALLLYAYSARMRHSFRLSALALAVVAALVLLAKPQVVEKNQELIEQHLFLSYRDDIWRAGIESWRHAPWLGVGIGRYGEVSQASHGHSVYINTLVERGALGLAALLAFFAAWGWSLARALPREDSPPLLWAYWGGAAGAWLIAVMIGLVNTTLHHEHALASMLLLGGWLSLRARAR